VLLGGGAPDPPGYFCQPTVLADVPPDAGILDKEIFARWRP
jgi:succinate-semialdehyde dehydrogenase / glutarate-semialdehyde dehydrogenase